MMRAALKMAVGLLAGAVATPAVAASGGLEWNTREQRYEAKPGEAQAEFAFVATNRSDQPVEVVNATTSCGCTAAVMPRKPWVIAPGASDTLRVIVDLRGRRGGLTKTIYVDTSAGEELLLVHVKVPPPPAVQREMNLMQAQADRQAVLRGDCASCHVAPAVGKRGHELFQAACAICHEAKHRADFVPDLAKAEAARDAAYWKKWIREGREGTLMPAFAQENGGSLDEQQVESLVAYLMERFPPGS